MSISSFISTYAGYMTLPYKNLDQWSAIKMALPYAWVNWIFLTGAVYLSHLHKLSSPIQVIFLLTMFKTALDLLFIKFYLKDSIYRSDLVGLLFVVLAFFANSMHLFSKYVFPSKEVKDEKETKESKEQKDMKDIKEHPKEESKE
jgi:hypothetical protein